MAEAKQVLLGENLFTSGDKPTLLGTHCKSCGDYFFPRTFTCHNPKCKEKQVEQVNLNRRGKVSSYTVMNYPPPPPFIAPEKYDPIPVADVAFPEGIHVLGMMEGCTPAEVKIGMEVEVVVGVLYTTKAQEQIIGWKFKPV
jgi:uncharacterized OB-fold protein